MQTIDEMVQMAIANAEFHGIKLRQGVENRANGDCAIEAIADNINTRPCFNEIIDGCPVSNRRKWLTETEELVFNFAGIPRDVFQREWNLLKTPRTYEYTLGDFVLPAIAHCVRKDILIFNTKADGLKDPILVVQASTLGNRQANTRIPVVLAYNNVHFEGLVPCSQEDELKTVELRDLYVSNMYTITKEDIPIFKNISLPWRTKTAARSKLDNNALPKKKIKEMTPAEKREYNRLKQQERRDNLSKQNKDAIKELDRLSKAQKRESERNTNLSKFKEQAAAVKANQRSKARKLDESLFKSKQAAEKSKKRAEARNTDEIGFKSKRAAEKSKERTEARNTDEIGFKSKRTAEKSKERVEN